MEKPSLVILAAGMGSRYGGLKQVDPVGPAGETIIHYSVYDALRAGFGKVVFVIRESFEEAFKNSISRHFENKIEVKYVFQEVNAPIEGIDKLPEREKPWGTGHAIMMAHNVVNEPFAAINADDYYGIQGFQKMADFLNTRCSESLYSMIGYNLKNTLSEYGSVSRGICEMDAQNHLTNVIEHHKIEKLNGQIQFLKEENSKESLKEENLVSMNFWGFHPNVFEFLRKQFITFVNDNKQNSKSEFYIPSVVNELIHSGTVKVSVIPNDDQWYGVTFRKDKEVVQQAFAQLSEKGSYSSPLWK